MKKLFLLITAVAILETTVYCAQDNALQYSLFSGTPLEKVYSEFKEQDIDKRYEQLAQLDLESCQEQVNQNIEDWNAAHSGYKKLRNASFAGMAISAAGAVTLFTIGLAKLKSIDLDSNDWKDAALDNYAFGTLGSLGALAINTFFAGYFDAKIRNTSDYVFDQLKNEKAKLQKFKNKILSGNS